MLEKRTSQQWYDPKLDRFLPDRFVSGKCPNPKCDNDSAYSDECDRCGHAVRADASCINPRSAISDAIPVLQETAHWWLDMWKVSEILRVWIQGKRSQWRKPVFNEVIDTVLPSLRFDTTHEPKYKEIKAELPKHKSSTRPARRSRCSSRTKTDLEPRPVPSSRSSAFRASSSTVGRIARSPATSPGEFRCPTISIPR